MTKATNDQAFRVPNSVIQSITTASPAALGDAIGLNDMTAFQTVTTLGLMALVDSKHPTREVRTSVAKLLRILQVSRNVATAVDRKWTNADGDLNQKTYDGVRFSPHHAQMINSALLSLFNKTVVIQKSNWAKGTEVDRIIHLLDSFGYIYQRNGSELDVHTLPSDQKENIGAPERPVWRVRTADENSRIERPVAICFRLNRELARELTNEQGTIGFTILAFKVFTLFRKFMKRPAMLRLIVLVLRQTGHEFTRKLDKAISELRFDTTHRNRALAQLDRALAELVTAGIVLSFQIDEKADDLRVQINRDWSRDGQQGGPRP